MIKWFCDVCTKEIKAPDNPVRVRAYRCGKDRNDAEIGWSEDNTIEQVFCHKDCADVLETEIQAAFFRARRVAANNG